MNTTYESENITTAVSLATNRRLRALAAKQGAPASKLMRAWLNAAPHASQLPEAVGPYNMPLAVHLRPEALANVDAARGNLIERGEYLRRVVEWGLRQ